MGADFCQIFFFVKALFSKDFLTILSEPASSKMLKFWNSYPIRINPQYFGAKGMKGGYPKPFSSQHIFQPLAHFVCGFVGECNGENIPRAYPLFDKISHPASKRSGFAAARSRKTKPLLRYRLRLLFDFHSNKINPTFSPLIMVNSVY